MATYVTVGRAKSENRARGEVARREYRWAVTNTLSLLKDDAIVLSSGPLTARDRARADRPYAKRHGPAGKPSAMPLGDPAVINTGRGIFRRRWKTDPPQANDRLIIGRLANDSEVSAWLKHGTQTAIARPTEDRLRQKALVHLRSRLDIVQRDWRRRYG